MFEPFYRGAISYQDARESGQPIPANDVWVYQRPTRIDDVIWGSSSSPTYLPRLSMRTPTFHRFQQRVTTLLSLPFFDTLQVKILMNILAEVILLDPIKYYQSRLYSNDDIPLFETKLQDILYSTKVSSEEATARTFERLVPSATHQLVSGTNLSFIAQNLAYFTVRGMEARMTIKGIEFSPAWTMCIERANIRFAAELHDLKKRVLAAYNSFTTQPRRGDFREYCDTLLKAYKQSMWDKMHGNLENLINEVRGVNSQITTGSVTVGSLAELKATLLNCLIQNTITQVITAQGILDAQKTNSPQTLSTTLSLQDRASQRQQQVQNLYDIAQYNGWYIMPPQSTFHEYVTIQFGNEYDLALFIPYNYPHEDIIVTAMRQEGSRLPYTYINDLAVPALQQNRQNLSSFIKSIVSNFLADMP